MASVPPIIASHTPELSLLCTRFRVRRLALFGSALTGRFEPGRSDLDFLVEFEPPAALDAANRYFGLLHALQTRFSRRIDLVDLSAIENPYFLRAIQRSRTVLYAA